MNNISTPLSTSYSGASTDYIPHQFTDYNSQPSNVCPPTYGAPYLLFPPAPTGSPLFPLPNQFGQSQPYFSSIGHGAGVGHLGVGCFGGEPSWDNIPRGTLPFLSQEGIEAFTKADQAARYWSGEGGDVYVPPTTAQSSSNTLPHPNQSQNDTATAVIEPSLIRLEDTTANGVWPESDTLKGAYGEACHAAASREYQQAKGELNRANDRADTFQGILFEKIDGPYEKSRASINVSCDALSRMVPERYLRDIVESIRSEIESLKEPVDAVKEAWRRLDKTNTDLIGHLINSRMLEREAYTRTRTSCRHVHEENLRFSTKWANVTLRTDANGDNVPAPFFKAFKNITKRNPNADKISFYTQSADPSTSTSQAGETTMKHQKITNDSNTAQSTYYTGYPSGAAPSTATYPMSGKGFSAYPDCGPTPGPMSNSDATDQSRLTFIELVSDVAEQEEWTENEWEQAYEGWLTSAPSGLSNHW
ncbi:uncharacterized protein IL334_000020 [Kwoniella shivajii]|uniref:Uncharacterized protein n=1 Tax=Kwoniella shivajii TaxID=564305 RepID=A0ABZ1CS74_9TREE|nr:hypothetical protein IL334_000020 [Kwoniella shivajii]